MENEEIGLWNKTQAELTAGDQVKLAVVATVAVTAATVAIYGVIAGGAVLWAKLQDRRSESKQEIYLHEEK